MKGIPKSIIRNPIVENLENISGRAATYGESASQYLSRPSGVRISILGVSPFGFNIFLAIVYHHKSERLPQLRIAPPTNGLRVGKYDQPHTIGRKKINPIPKPARQLWIITKFVNVVIN